MIISMQSLTKWYFTKKALGNTVVVGVSELRFVQLLSGNEVLGWRKVFTGLAVEFTVIGFLYSFPIFWPYLISELGMTESQLGMITAFYFIPVAILAILLAALLISIPLKIL